MTCSSHLLRRQIAFHCAPTLLGLKPASLMTPSPEHHASLGADIDQTPEDIASNPDAIHFFRLSPGNRSCQLLVFRPLILGTHLYAPPQHDFLSAWGYDAASDLPDLLSTLREHWAATGIVPHEIGIFLGYPTSDVEIFIKRPGRKPALSGYWQVYSNPDAARRTFACYDFCRNYILQALGDGTQLEEFLATIPGDIHAVGWRKGSPYPF